MTPIGALRHQANSRPNAKVSIFGDEVWSYQRLATEAGRRLPRR
jgi:hypothetical protein